MEIREWHSSMAKEWDNFVHSAPNGSLFHTTRWKNVLERTFNYRSVLLSVYERDRIVGVLPLFWVPKPIKGQQLVSVPFGVYGGICADTQDAERLLLEAAQDLAIGSKVDSLEFRQMEKFDEALPTKDLYLRVYTYR